MQIIAQYKCTDVIKATEATALALQDTEPKNQLNMQQHITKLVQETVKTHLSTPSKKQKNSSGSKIPQPSLPQKEEGEPTYKNSLVFLPHHRYGRQYRKQHCKDEKKITTAIA